MKDLESEASIGVGLKELLARCERRQICWVGTIAEKLWLIQDAPRYSLAQERDRGRIEGAGEGEQFVKHDPKTPDISRRAIRLPLRHFGRDVEGRTAVRCR